MSTITKNNPAYTERYSIALSDVIRFAKDHNNEIPEDKLQSYFSGIAFDEEDQRQMTYVLHANGIHLAEESYRLSREERAPQGISFPLARNRRGQDEGRDCAQKAFRFFVSESADPGFPGLPR